MSLPSIQTVACKSALSKSTLPGLAYTFNPYIGCTHGCLYCYVPDVLRGRVISSKWGSEVMLKEPILDRLKFDLHRAKKGIVGVSTVTDPYQQVERSLCITREALKLLKEAQFPVSIQTKSALVVRDIDIIREGNMEVGITVTSMNDSFRRLFEPRASPPAERARALKELCLKGIHTWIFYGPIIPGYNDSLEDIQDIVELAAETQCRIIYDRLNLKPLMLSRINKNLTKEKIVQIRRGISESTFMQLRELCRKSGIKCEFAFPNR